MLHPLLLGMLMASGWLMLGLQVQQESFMALRFGAVVSVCGSLPVYTLGFASHRTPPAVVVAWQVHTVAQLLTGGLLMDWIL